MSVCIIRNCYRACTLRTLTFITNQRSRRLPIFRSLAFPGVGARFPAGMSYQLWYHRLYQNIDSVIPISPNLELFLEHAKFTARTVPTSVLSSSRR